MTPRHKTPTPPTGILTWRVKPEIKRMAQKLAKQYGMTVQDTIDMLIAKEYGGKMNEKPTYEQIAKSFDLWGEYVDPQATMTQEQFDAMSVKEKIKIQIDLYGEE